MVTGAEDTFLYEKDSRSFLKVTFSGKSSRQAEEI